MRNLFEVIKGFFKGVDRGMREVSTSLIQDELEEYENAFALLTMGFLSGLPSPPTGLVIRLFPHMQREIQVMMSKSSGLFDAFGSTMGKFSVD